MSSVSVYAAETDDEDPQSAVIRELEARIAELQAQMISSQGANDVLSDMIEELQKQLEEAKKPPAKAKAPKIKLQEPSSVVTIKSTSSHTSKLTLKNIGAGDASNILVQADIPSGTPLVVYFTNNSNLIRSISQNRTATAALKIEFDQAAESGTYAIPLRYTYFDADNNEITDTDTFYIKLDVPAAASESFVVISDFSSNKNILSAGDVFALEAVLQNSGGGTARNIQVTLDNLAPDGVYLEHSTGSVYIAELSKGGKKSVPFNLKAADKAKTGTYPIAFKLTWQNEKGEPKESVYTYYAVVSGADEESAADMKIKAGQVVCPTRNLFPGEDFTVVLPITNIAGEPVSVTIAADAGAEGAVVPRSADKVVINNLEPGQTQELSFSFMATSKSESRNYAIGFTVSYDTGVGEDKKTTSFSQYAGVNVKNPEADKKEEDEEKKSMPKIIISRYEADPIVVRAGENFDLTIAFLNTHSEKTIKNIKAYLTSVNETAENKRGSVFTPVNASNTFYIDEIAPKAETERHMTFYTVPDAEPRNYIINVNFEYEDADGTEYKATEEFGINVKQITKIDTGDINIPTEGFIGTPVSVYFDFYNTGKVTLSNLMIKIEGEFDTSITSSYYSNFQPGAYDSYDMSFTPNEPGEKTGRIVISYQDEAGEEVNVYKDFTMNVMDMGGGAEMADPGIMMGRPQPEEQRAAGFFTSPVFIISAAALVVIIIVVIVLVRRGRRKRRELEQDE